MHANTNTVVAELVFLRVYPSGWGMGKIRTPDGQKTSVNGNALAGLREKSEYEFTGRYVTHDKFGEALQVSSVSVHVPQSKEAVLKYLQTNYAGVGKKSAEKFIDHHIASGKTLEDLRETLIKNPFAVDFSSVTKRKTAAKTSGGVRGAIYRQLATQLGAHDIPDGIFRSLSVYYETKFTGGADPVGDSWNEFIENPYAPIREVGGYGFLRADLLGKKLQFPQNAPARIAALATHAVDIGCNTNGHTYLLIDDFIQKIKLLDPCVNAEEAVVAAMQMGEPITEDCGRYYLNKYYKAEKFLAMEFARRLSSPIKPLFARAKAEVEGAIDVAAKSVGITLDESQRSAVYGILTSTQSVHSITAPPGCGKTAIMEVVLGVLEKTREIETVGLCAPTGKAAKVLTARVSKYQTKATTIHSMLGVGGPGGFVFNHANKLPFDILVCDEASMIDVSLMNSVMSATKPDTHVIFLGDPKQLPSVGPGDCLTDILSLGFDHHRLNKTHRNDGGILEVVNMAGSGSLVNPNESRSDVDFVDGLPEATEESVRALVQRFDIDLQAVNGDFAAVGLMVARRKGDPTTPGWNVTYLNHVMRERYNATGAKIPGTTFRVNDRIIIRKNQTLVQPPEDDGFPTNPEHVVNGDTGFIRGFQLKESTDANTEDGDGSVGTIKSMTLELDDGRSIQYGVSGLDALGHSYAITVHAAQGSEYQRVISICVNGSSNFIHRGILFTAWSRAQTKLTVVGDQEVIRAILKRPAPKRNSYLVQRSIGASSGYRKDVWDAA